MGIPEIVAAQREYYLSGATRAYEFRRDALLALQRAVCENESPAKRVSFGQKNALSSRTGHFFTNR